MSRPLHIAVVDEELPYPANSGKRIRTLNLLLPLARRHRITYLAHPSVEPGETEQARAFLEEHGIKVRIASRRLPAKSGASFYGRLALNLLSPLPYSVQTHNSPALRQTLREFAAANRVDLWHCEWTPYAESVRRSVSGPWVAVAHNVESLIWRRYFETEANPAKRWYIGRQWRKFAAFERNIFAEAAQVIAVSEADAQLARREFQAPRVSVVDNGVDVAAFAPDGTPRDGRRILFLGSLDWRPNLDGVLLLLDQIFPRVLAAEPEARLQIVGRKPPAWLTQRAAKCRNVELHADVPDVRPFLRGCGMLAVPLRIGGGSRLKILEALANQCPVVSTRVGAEGLRLDAGAHYMAADSPTEMAAALVDAMRWPAALAATAREGHTVVRRQYDWSTLADQLEAVWLAAQTVTTQPDVIPWKEAM